ncbi:hypothetical protein AC579_9924 [Pseudocercospora musae]|uniref:Uncharacterized protein n=1 Tax=Pseudocercospora musae TaxID=113226 RepID=A0A139I3K4_9PEZI|nr:hypothetical protein AC579_9924 [Pseudocercospora musae]KXT09279.1 hypothetical protein AC579_9924 [Pseudocercospora musae]KXT09281.1 hypothetical protein AC579_9924 [Pseudocercospora musae]KXT09283.1 hypothetical protein AC579_9924 [Pseudocercospora musae]
MEGEYVQSHVRAYVSKDQDPDAVRCLPATTRDTQETAHSVWARRRIVRSPETPSTDTGPGLYAPEWPGRDLPPRIITNQSARPMQQFGAGQITAGFNPQTHPHMPNIVFNVDRESGARQNNRQRRNDNGNKRARHAPKQDHEKAELQKTVKRLEEDIRSQAERCQKI